MALGLKIAVLIGFNRDIFVQKVLRGKYFVDLVKKKISKEMGEKQTMKNP